MIKVIHSFPVWLPQTQTWMFTQIASLPNDVDCYIVCERTENLDQFGLPNILSLSEANLLRRIWDTGLKKIGIRNYLGFLIHQAKTQNIQILHSHFGNIGWANVAGAERLRLKHIVTFYGQEIGRFPKQDSRWFSRYKDLFSSADRILCEGPYMRQTIISLGCPPDKVQVHHLGIKTDQISFTPRTWKRPHPLRVLIAASFREKKGIPYALEALGHFQLTAPVEITLIGDAVNDRSSETEKVKILNAISRYRLTNKIRLLGFQPYNVVLNEAYNHHVFLAPSVTAEDGDTEGGAPVTIIEMAATGMPIISTKHCDIPEIISHRITGLLSEERDAYGIVRNLLFLLNHPEEWKSMVTAARNKVAREFNAAVQGILLANIYQEVIENPIE